MSVTADTGGQDNAAQIAYWNDRAAMTWTSLQNRIDLMFTPLTTIALDAAAPVLGERVVDVGCGCGATVLALAGRVGPDGHVLGVDVSEPMTARAKQRIAEAGLSQAEVRVADASTFAFAPASTDLLFSRFGVMFFADPTAAFANLRRAMRPKGRLLFAAWRDFADNSWFSVPVEAAKDLLPPSPPTEPDAPGPFAFANPDRVSALLGAAGWTDIGVTRHDMPIRLAPAGQVAEAAEFVTRMGALARALGEAEPELRTRVAAAVADVLRGYDSPAGICLGGSIWLVSARNGS